MRRRRAIALGVGAVAWPPFARAQPAAPLIGFLSGRSPQTDAHLIAAFHRGLAPSGFVDGGTARIEYRFADGRYEALPALAAELVALRPAVLVAVGGSASGLAAKAATTTIPVIFAVGGDPVALGIVAGLARPGGNLTGMTMFSAALDAKRMELLRELAPEAKIVAAIMNPGNPSTEAQLRQARVASAALGLTLALFAAQTDAEIDEAFRAISHAGAGALAIASDAYLIGRRDKIVGLATALRLPAIYPVREFVEAGGLMSYGTDFADLYREVGAYAARVLKGEMPASLPVQEPTRYELLINLRAAKALGLVVPGRLAQRADELIE